MVELSRTSGLAKKSMWLAHVEPPRSFLEIEFAQPACFRRCTRSTCRFSQLKHPRQNPWLPGASCNCGPSSPCSAITGPILVAPFNFVTGSRALNYGSRYALRPIDTLPSVPAPGMRSPRQLRRQGRIMLRALGSRPYQDGSIHKYKIYSTWVAIGSKHS